MSPEEEITYQLSYFQHIFIHTNASNNTSQLSSTLVLSGGNFNLNQILLALFSIQENEYIERNDHCVLKCHTVFQASCMTSFWAHPEFNLSVESKLITNVFQRLFTTPLFVCLFLVLVFVFSFSFDRVLYSFSHSTL